VLQAQHWCSYDTPSVGPLVLQAQVRDALDTGSPHVCRLPGSTCSEEAICPGSQVTYDLAPRTGSFSKPGVKDGEVVIFTQPDGGVVVTVTTQCNCLLSVVGANGNTVNLGPNFDPADSSAQTANCPAGLNWFSNPTSAAVTLPALYSCMSWVLPKQQVQEAMAASSTPGSVVITMHFAVSCYSDCGVVVGTPTATQVHSSGPAEDVRCDLSPFRGVVYRPPTDCITPEGTTALQLPPSQPPADKVPPPPALSRPPPRPVRPPPMPVVLSAESENCSSTPGGNPEHCSTCSGAECLKSTCEAGDVKVGGSSMPLPLLHSEPSPAYSCLHPCKGHGARGTARTADPHRCRLPHNPLRLILPAD
jgi:hypothetical protein